jgi:hypothetical protein
MPPPAQQGPPVTTFKIVPVAIDKDFTPDDGYFIKELVQATEKDRIMFYAVLGKIPDQKKIDLAGGVMDKATAAEIGRRAKKGGRR